MSDDDDDDALGYMVTDQDGNPLPYTPQQARAYINRMIETGDLEAVVVRMGEGRSVQLFQSPTQEMADVFDAAARAMRKVLKGH